MKDVSAATRHSVAVVGGGIIGLSIAWRLARAHYRVTVFEQRTAGGESSWAGAGMLAPGGEVDEPGALGEMAIESRRMYGQFVRELEHEVQVAIDYQECGGLDIAYSEQELASLEERAKRQRALGIHSKRITPAHLAAFWPRIRCAGLLGGRFYPGDAIVNPRELTHALKCACRKAGGTVHEYCLVRGLQVGAEEVLVRNSWQDERFGKVIVAAGAWSSLIEVRGAPALPKAEPVKGHLIGYRQPEQTCNTIVRHGNTYLLQRGNGLLIAGSSIEHVGFDRDLSPSIEAELKDRAGFVLPHLSETTPSETWMGFRPGADELHIEIGRAHV